MKLLTLDGWLEANYAEPRPSILTARRWCREGKIQPPPQKHGRSYRVRPDAIYTKGTTRLIDKLKNGAPPKPRARSASKDNP